MTASKSIWYPRYPGDYGRKTAHLSLAEHGAYALLMDYAYSNGGVIPANAVQVHRICRAFASDEQTACMAVVEEFFELREDGWHNDRVDEELLRRGDISEKRAKAAKIRHANAVASAGASGHANAHTVTVTVTEEEKEEPNGSSKKPKRAVSLPDGWVPSDKNASDALAKGFNDGEINAEADKFRDYHLARGSTYKDWDAAWRTWIGNARRFAGAAQGSNARGRSAHQTMFDAFQSVASERSGRT